MKNCRTVNGLLKAIKNGEQACLKYSEVFRDSRNGVYEIYLANNKKEIVTTGVYNKISRYLQQV